MTSDVGPLLRSRRFPFFITEYQTKARSFSGSVSEMGGKVTGMVSRSFPLAASSAEPPRQRRLIEDPFGRADPFGPSTDRHQEASLAGHDQITATRDVAGHDRDRGRHRLHDRIG